MIYLNEKINNKKKTLDWREYLFQENGISYSAMLTSNKILSNIKKKYIYIRGHSSTVGIKRIENVYTVTKIDVSQNEHF